LRFDLIAENGADLFTRSTRVIRCRFASTMEDLCGAPERVAGEEAHEIEEVRAKDDHVFSTGAVVLFAMGAELEQVANNSFAELALECLDDWGEVHLVRDGGLEIFLFGDRDQFVGLGQRRGERFFGINVRARFEGCLANRMVRVAPAHGDADETWLFFGEHLAVVAIVALRVRAQLCFGATRIVRIGNGNDFDIVAAVENDVQAVPVIAGASVADDGGTMAFCFGGDQTRRGQSRADRRGGGEKFTTSPDSILHKR
jgi:hypothetical protein